MIRAAVLLLGFAVALPVHAETISPALTWGGRSDLPNWTDFVPPPAAFSLSITGEASVAAGAALDLRLVVNPIVIGLPPRPLTCLLFGRLPEGATFDAATGKIGGRVLETGSHRVWVSATDSTGATVTAGVTIVVT
ncbi:Ig domain-containing protein [Rhizobium laguerreae]|uniref:Ig domain-containing protein n=1 Tax=Rhizobium laguerreae TaxID=1076926 RepID=UPI001C91B749|nr:Ig domain-containing protein [Rhizobium laguerreae]MBY3167382.1 hypothetical protein [Rhizobium laguerreae]